MIYRYINVTELNIDEISMKVSKERLLRAEKYKHESDKRRSIAVEYLLNELIGEYNQNIFDVNSICQINTPVQLSYDEKGKPHIYHKGADAIEFSLSHSGDYVACIVSDEVCGIDIEKHSERPYDKIARRVCTDSEGEYILNVQGFYDIWTLKESVLKATGKGLSLDMRTFSFNRIDDETYVTSVEGVTYIGHVLKAPDGYSLSYVERQ